MLESKNIVLWDWNGTLLDDTDICIQAMNMLLEKRDIQMLCKEKYREVFDFPVKDYYSRIGFDFEKEPFEIPAIEFIEEYKMLLPQANLFEDVIETLGYFQKKGFRQYIVSAMEKNALIQSVLNRGIYDFFDEVCGISDDYAHGKFHLFGELIEKQNISKTKAIIIGDTLHDYEIANKLEIDVVLISRGHQSHTRLKNTEKVVLSSLSELINSRKTNK
ncbi:MAG: HAD family hydrolase [Bacteroidetes bacterium]|nr:HAD family hydrolase [Bacteroidota bacterium]